eukprot:gene3717-7384_t
MCEPEGRISSIFSDRVSYGLIQYASESDEDRYTTKMSHKQENLSEVSSFGIFDGHGGAQAAKVCANELHKLVLNRYKEWENLKPDKEIFSVDARFCHSVKLAMENLDSKIRMDTTSGSTAVSIFLFPISNGSTRVLCPWVGDSRCVMFKVHPETGHVVSTVMTDDHKPTLKREYDRIQNKFPVQWKGLPIERINKNDDVTSCDNENEKFTVLTQNSKDEEELHTTNNDDNNNTIGNNLADDLNQDIMFPPMKYSSSFIQKRNDESYKSVGLDTEIPLAVFSRFGVSLTMTRSIGDRYGARSCVCVPDISALTLAPNEYARFVLASDGLWDVVSVEAVQTVVMGSRDPSQIARKLALMAWHKRVSKSIRMDDITVLVVDINPRAFRRGSLTSTCGTSCTIA